MPITRMYTVHGTAEVQHTVAASTIASKQNSMAFGWWSLPDKTWQFTSALEDVLSEPMPWRVFACFQRLLRILCHRACFQRFVRILCHCYHRTLLHESEAIISSSRGRFPFAFTKLQENLTGCCVSAPSIDHRIMQEETEKSLEYVLDCIWICQLTHENLSVALSLTWAVLLLLNLLCWNCAIQSESSLQTKDDFFTKYIITSFGKRWSVLLRLGPLGTPLYLESRFSLWAHKSCRIWRI